MSQKLLFLLAFALLLIQCNQNTKQKIEGIWQLQKLEINGTVLQGEMLSSWKWKFNSDGEYLTDVSGLKETGKYCLEGNKLTLNPSADLKRPVKILNIVSIDSDQLDLATADGGSNKSSLHFVKLKD